MFLSTFPSLLFIWILHLPLAYKPVNNILLCRRACYWLDQNGRCNKKDFGNRPDEDRLKDVDETMEQYKLGNGKQITIDEELDAFIDSLWVWSGKGNFSKPNQPYDPFFPDIVMIS